MWRVQKFVPDTDFIYVDDATTVKTPDLLSMLSTLRFFPVTKGEKYLVKTMHYYGEYDGREQPTAVEQIINGD